MGKAVRVSRREILKIAGILGLASLLSACAGKEVQVEERATPTSDLPKTAEPTATAAPSATPTKEPPPQPPPTPTEVKPTLTPEKMMTKEEALAEVDRIIKLVQNPDPTLAAKFDKESLRIDNEIIISGVKDLKNPKPYDAISLLGIKEAIDQGSPSAHERIKNLILSSSFKAPKISVLGKSDDGTWWKEEIDKYDPQRKIIKPETLAFGYSKFREEPMIALFRLYYGMPAQDAR